MTIIPRWYQEEAIDAVYNYFMTKNGNPLIGLPGGTGKSIIPAIFINRVMRHWPQQRFLLITHIAELVKQNAEKLLIVWPNAPLGIHSASLKQRDVHLPIIYGMIQSMIKNPASFGHRDIIWVDEAHLVNQDENSMYQTFFETMRLINPNVKIIGMTATPYRMGHGLLTDDGLFTDMCYDLTDMEGFNRLVAEGYLAPLIPKRTNTEIDISNVSMSKGDYVLSQLEKAADKNEITYAGLRELIECGQNRKSWLIFASGIEHSEHIKEMMDTFGVDCFAVHSKKSQAENDLAITAFKRGELRSIVNFGKLTTGFDYPAIDLIGDFRPTMSIPLHVQKYCRGTRPADGKLNCLVMDFARNTPRLGPINDPVIPKKKGEKQGDAPVKICNSCGAYNHASARFCCDCGEEFEFKIKIFAKSSNDELIRGDFPIIEDFDVNYAIYAPFTSKKPNSPRMMKVTYFTGIRSFNEFVCLEHKGYALHKAHNWWKQRHKTEPPTTIEQALVMQAQLRVPSKIKVWVNKHYPEIVGVIF